MITDILMLVGQPTIDNNLGRLLKAMEDMPSEQEFISTMVGTASAIGLTIALCVGAYEAWMMMLGRRGMDVMKLLRIVGLSICITSSAFIVDAVGAPGKVLEKGAQGMCELKNAEVMAMEKQLDKLQDDYDKKLANAVDTMRSRKMAEEGITANSSTFDKAVYTVTNLGGIIEDYAKKGTAKMVTLVGEGINSIIRYIGQIIFQMTYYGLLIAQRVFMCILAMFCPIAFALSIAPPWSNAWSQWIGKYVSLSLWGFVTYMCLYYIDFVMLYTLQKDAETFQALGARINASWSNIGVLVWQNIGSWCMYVVAQLAGAKVLSFVPEVASWLVPGGVSSGAGSSAAAVSGTIASTGASVGKSAAAFAAGTVVVGGAKTMAEATGAYQQARSDGHSRPGAAMQAAASMTGLGQSYAAGAQGSRNVHNVGTNDTNYTPGGQ